MSYVKITRELIIRMLYEFPKFEIVQKDTSSFMKFLNFFVQVFNKNFMTHYITVVGYKVYVPKGFDAERAWPVLAHEWVHMKQHKRNKAFAVLYLFPQVLAVLVVLSLLAIWLSNWWLLCLLFLLCAAPLPAPFRYEQEMEAYAVNVFASHIGGYASEEYFDRLAAHFYSSNYYFMWPFKEAVRGRIRRIYRDVVTGEYNDISPFSDILEIKSELPNSD